MKRFFKLLSIISFALIPALCFAVDLSSQIPSSFPKQKPTPKVYSARATIQAFYDSWADNIGSDIKIKSFDTEFIGIGYKNEITDDVFPEWNIPKTQNQNFITCNLYSGIFNNTAYKKLRTPLLYDEEHNICVAATAVRDYSKTDLPYFEEPREMQNVVSISGYFPNIPHGSIKLKEIALIPNTANDEKKLKDM